MGSATTNLRSVRQKYAVLSDLVSSKQIDILAMTETWLSSCDTAACLADISPPGFSLFHCPRPSGRGGGVAFLVRETFKVKIIHSPKFLSLVDLFITRSNCKHVKAVSSSDGLSDHLRLYLLMCGSKLNLPPKKRISRSDP